MVQGCIELKNDLTFFNGVDFLVHIPFKHLTDSSRNIQGTGCSEKSLTYNLDEPSMKFLLTLDSSPL